MRPLAYLLALIFIASGGAKILALPFEVTAFERWGYPIEFMYLTGICELMGGLALALNILRKYSAGALSLLMTGAIVTHIQHQEWPMMLVATSIFGLSVFLTLSLWRGQLTQKTRRDNEDAE